MLALASRKNPSGPMAKEPCASKTLMTFAVDSPQTPHTTLPSRLTALNERLEVDS